MTAARTFDVIIIGAGPGGEGAAMRCAKAGRRVCVVEKYNMVGGGCTHWGTIPSKALRHAIQEIVRRARAILCQDSTLAIPLGDPLGERTPYADIHMIRAAEVVTVTENEVSHQKYWHWDKIKPSTNSEEELIADLYRCFNNAVK